MKKNISLILISMIILSMGCNILGGGEEVEDEVSVNVGRHTNPKICTAPGVVLVPSIDDSAMEVGDVTTASLEVVNCYDNELKNIGVSLLPSTRFLDVTPDPNNPGSLSFDERGVWEFDIEPEGARRFNLYFEICYDYSQEYIADFTVKPGEVGIPMNSRTDTGPLNYVITDLKSFKAEDYLRPKFGFENIDEGYVYESRSQGLDNNYLSSGVIKLLNPDSVFSFSTRERRVETVAEGECPVMPDDYATCRFEFYTDEGNDYGVAVDETLNFRIDPDEERINEELLTSLILRTNYTYCYSGSDLLGITLEVLEG